MPQPSRPVVKQLIDRAIDVYNLKFGIKHRYFEDSEYVPYLGLSQGVKYTLINTHDTFPVVSNNLMWMYFTVFFTYCPGIYDSVIPSTIDRDSSTERGMYILVGRKHMFDVQRELALVA